MGRSIAATMPRRMRDLLVGGGGGGGAGGEPADAVRLREPRADPLGSANAGSRRRRYVAEDVWLLKQRKQHRRDPAKTARDALHWGLPVLESRLSVIHGGRLYYRRPRRRRSGAQLHASSRSRRCSGAATSRPRSRTTWSRRSRASGRQLARARRDAAAAGSSAAVPARWRAARDPFAFDLRPAAVQRAGARILRLLAAAAVGARPSKTAGRARCCSGAGRRGRRTSCALLDAALVLYADNGLNPSSFTARCVASAGRRRTPSSPPAWRRLQGTKHGGACERAEGLLARRATRAARGRRRRATAPRRIDPGLRPSALSRRRSARRVPARSDSPSAGRAVADVEVAFALVDAVREVMNEHPTVDFARRHPVPRARPAGRIGAVAARRRPRRRLDRARPRAIPGRPRDPPARALRRRSPAGLSERGSTGLRAGGGPVRTREAAHHPWRAARATGTEAGATHSSWRAAAVLR